MESIFIIGASVVGIILVIALILSMYVKAPPDTAYIISGLRKEQKILIGRGGIKIPVLNRLDKLTLKLIPLDIKTSAPVPTRDCINIFVDSAVNVKVSNSIEDIKLAAVNFLNKSPENIGMIVKEVLEGNVREIICMMDLRELIGDRKKFVSLVVENVKPDLKAMGLELVSFNVQNFRDENGVIEDLGIDNISKIKKDAQIAKAVADKEVSIAQSQAKKEANDARVLSESQIAEKNNELFIKQAELKRMSDTKKAEADAAYEIQKQEQLKTIQTATVNAEIAKAEREAELNKQQVLVEQQRLEAEVNKKADAEKYAIEQRAQAELSKRQREAEARQYEQVKEAEAQKSIAEAKKYAMQQEAEGISAKGIAEAEAIRAKGLAEAEALEKKADAMKKYGHAAMMEMIVKALPDMAKAIAEPMSNIDKVTIIDGGNGEGGVSSMGSYVPSVLAKTIESVKEATGVDIREIMKADTYDAKVNKNINVSGIPSVDVNIENKDQTFDE